MAFEKRGPMILARPTAASRNPGWPALKPCFRNDGSIRRPTQRLERGFVLQQRGALIAPSARSGGLEDVDGGPDCRVYSQMRGIEQVRVGSLLQGRGGALAVALIPFDDVGQHRGLVDMAPMGLVFGCPPAGAHLRRGGHVNLLSLIHI